MTRRLDSFRNSQARARTKLGGRKDGSNRLRRSMIPASASLGFSRKLSSIAVWCTHEMVQKGAHPFGVSASRRRSSNGVFLKRNPGSPTLLRAVVHQSVLADIEESAAGAAMPTVRLSKADVRLKAVEVIERKKRRPEFLKSVVHRFVIGR